MKRKIKSKSKPKLQQQSISNQKEQLNKCSVCRLSIQSNQPFLHCQRCNKFAHTSCYNPQENCSNKTFICDACKNKKAGKDCICVECNTNHQGDMLKKLGNNKDSLQFIHIQCALLSNFIQIQYSKMSFYRRVQKPRKSTRQSSQLICAYCSKSNQCPIIKCIQCSELCHFRCLEKREQNYYFFIYKWLDKCQKYNFLLQYIFSKKKSNIKNLIDHPVKHKNNQLQLYLCKTHADDYTYCYCGKQQLTIQQNKSADYMCDFCSRWVHQLCSGLPPDSVNTQFKCNGCKTDDIFKKQVKPNILFNQICLIQKSTGKLTQRSIRLLNAFPFKYSLPLQNKINQSIKQIQFYFIKKHLLRLAQESEQNDKKLKKIIQLVLFCAHGDKWKQFQSQLNKNQQKSGQIISKIADLKKFDFPQQIQQKIKKLLNIKDQEQVKNQIKKQINNKQYVQKFKEQLRQFIKKWSSFQKKNLHVDYLSLAQSISKLYYQLLNVIQHIKEIKQRQQFIRNFEKAFANTFFGQLISKKLSIQTIAGLLKKYSVLQFYLSQKRDLSQQQYLQLLQGQIIYIAQEQQQIYKQIIKKQVKKSNIKISVESLKNQVAFHKFEKQLSQKNKDFKYLQQAQRQIIKKQVCMLGAKNIFALNIKRIQNNVMKKKILKICNVQDHKIRQQNFSDISRIQQFLKRKKAQLAKSQIQCIQNYLGKLQLLLSLLKKGQSMQYFMGEEQTNVNLIEDERFERLNVIFIKLFHILDNWDQKIIPPQFVINQMYNRCFLRKVKFTNSLISEKFKIFVTITTKRMENLLDEGRKITIPLLRNLVKVLNYFHIQKQFPNIQQLFQNVKKWSTILIGEDQFIRISELLEKPQKASNLLKTIQIKLSTCVDLKNVYIYNQVNKLYLMRQWCRLTEKIQCLSKSKPTINGIQTLKTLLDRAAYPQNILFQHISQLQLESRTLNKYIIKYLQKPKAPEHLVFFEQIKFIANKMTLQQGYEIKQIFEKCKLDVYVQNQQLENQIKQFEQLPTNLIQQTEKRSLAELNIIRRKYIESSFKISKIEQYQYFLRKIYTLRCLNFEPPVTKQEYFQLLTIGGTAALYLQSKTSDLLRTYKAIQKAQTQLSTQISKKRNPNNLLPFNDQKYKQMKQDLRYDPNQLSKLQKARINNHKIRQQYMYLRTRKIDLEKYKQIQFQLSNSIFNNRDILSDISILKNDLNILVKRVQDVIPYCLPSPHLMRLENIFRRQHVIFEAYNNIKIRHPSLQKFQHDYRYYNKAQKLRLQMSKQNYRTYCDACSRVSDVGCKIPDFLNSRTNQFLKMFQLVMSSDKSQHHMYQILITEGLQLRRLQSSQKQRIFTMVIQIYEKIRQLANNDEIQQDEISGQSQMQQSMNQQDRDQDQDDLEQDQDDQMDQSDDIQMDDFQDEESDESSSPKGNQGKDNHIVLDSD